MLNIEPFVHRHFDYVRYGKHDMAVDCPFCATRYGTEDVKQKLQIAINKEVCHCWRCDYSASWVTLVQDLTGLSYIRALAEIYVTPKPILTSDIFAETASKPPNPRSNVFIMPEGYKRLSSLDFTDTAETRAIKKYLVGRGFGKHYWRDYNLGYVPSMWRVYIPIEGEFWQSRAIFPWMKPKYMSPENPAADVLFNAQALDIYDEIAVAEGAFSAMAIGANAVAMIGKNPTQEKVRRLCNATACKFIVIVEQNAWSILPLADSLAAVGKTVELWQYEGDKDPADRVEPQRSEYNLRKKLELAFR